MELHYRVADPSQSIISTHSAEVRHTRLLAVERTGFTTGVSPEWSSVGFIPLYWRARRHLGQNVRIAKW